MRYFRLHQDVFFEKGALGGALYDFMRRRVQALSPDETKIVEQLERNVAVSEVAGASAEEVESLVQRLRADSFGSGTATAQRRDRYMPVLKVNLQGLVEPPLVISVLQLSLTSSCALTCTGCGSTDGAVWMGCNGCERWPGVPANTAWSHASIEQFFDDVEPLDIRNIFFNGGDPLTAPDLLEHAIRRAQQRTRPPGIVISTNGSAATPALLDWLAECGVRLNFFILGETAEDYDEVCGRASAFDATMQAIAAAQVRAIPFNVTLRLDGLSPDAASRRRQWAATLGAQKVFVSERITIACDGGVAPAASLATTGPARVPQVTPEQFFVRRERHPCLTSTIAIGADLSVRPCPMIEDRALGHAGLESMHTVFRERRHERYWQLTKADIAGCSACEFRFACADCAAVDLAKRRQPALHAAICGYDPARASWHA